MPADAPAPPAEPELVSGDPREGGGTYRYRTATIRGYGKGDQVSTLDMPGHPHHGRSMGVPGCWVRLVDEWEDHQRLPAPYVWPPGGARSP